MKMGEKGRSEASHGGNGERDKDFHEQIGGPKKSPDKKMIVGILTAIVFVIIIVITLLNIQTSGNEAPGEAPEGKVWSPEHGHWHNAD